jgi:hypothetical protein
MHRLFLSVQMQVHLFLTSLQVCPECFDKLTLTAGAGRVGGLGGMKARLVRDAPTLA